MPACADRRASKSALRSATATFAGDGVPDVRLGQEAVGTDRVESHEHSDQDDKLRPARGRRS